MPSFSYTTKGTCSRRIDLEIDEGGIIRRVQFVSGCPGNTQGVARLAEGRPVEEIIRLVKGIRCGDNVTSCPDQLARALEAYLRAMSLSASAN